MCKRSQILYNTNMRQKVTKEKLLTFIKRLGAAAKSPGNCYFTGGASAVFHGWRETTLDVEDFLLSYHD